MLRCCTKFELKTTVYFDLEAKDSTNPGMPRISLMSFIWVNSVFILQSPDNDKVRLLAIVTAFPV